MALFEKSAPPALRTVLDDAASWSSAYEDQGESGHDEKDEAS
jgi:hypothetical protein